MKEKLLKIKNTLKRHRRAVRNTMIASVLVVCTLINCFWYDVQKAYAAAVPVGYVAAETILGLIATVGTFSGIVNHTKIKSEIVNMTEEESSAFNAEVLENDKALYKMLYDEGYFEGTPINDLVRASIYENDGTSALDKYLEQTNSRDKLTLITGKNNNSNNDGKIKMGIGASIGFLAQIRDGIEAAFEKFKENVKKQALQDAASIPIELPDAMPARPDGMTDYLVLYHKDTNTANFFWMKNPKFEFGQSPVKDRLNYAILSAEKSYKYEISDGQWKLVDGAVNDWYGLSGSPSNEKDATVAIENLIPYHSFLLQDDFLTLYGSYKIWGVSIPANTYKGQSMTADELEAKVNKALENNGYKTRYTPVEIPFEETIQKNMPSIEGTPLNKIYIPSDPSELAKILEIPVGAGINTDSSALPEIKSALQKLIDNAPELSPDEKEGLTDEPFTEYGPMSNYQPKGLADKFPFCVPFDIYRSIKLLATKAEAPRWEFPFRFQRWGIDETIVLDMSKFESVATISRWMETLIFTYVLASKTKQFMFT